MNHYDIALIASGAPRVIDAEGTYLRYYRGSAGGADETILVTTLQGGASLLLKPGQSIRLPVTIKQWRISNYANAATITGLVVIGYGALEDDRVTGEVSVIDGGRSVTLSGAAFVGGAESPALAANYSHVQLWCPAASGKRLIVKKVWASFPVAPATSHIELLTHNAALTTLVRSGLPKLLGGATSTAELRAQQNAAVIGTVGAGGFYVGANSPLLIPFEQPIVIPQGYGLAVHGQQNQAVWAVFEWIEELV